MYTIAVTGATGFVGNFVSNYLELKGFKIFRFGRKEQANIFFWDITHGTYDQDIKVDCVVHCAASVDDWTSYEESHAVNVIGTKNVLESFPQAEKFIYISSASVYDAFCEHTVISENVCIGGKLLNNYSKTKLLGEHVVKKSTIPLRVILRPHIIYGPGDTTISPRIKNGIKFGYLLMPGNGKNRISFTHVENLAEAIYLAIQLKQNGIFTYNITDAKPKIFLDALEDFKKLNNLNFKLILIPRKICLVIGSILEFVYHVFGATKSPLLTRYITDQISSDHILDISKAKTELNYNPTKSMERDFLI